MRDTSDVLTVSFDGESKDESGLCVTRKYRGETIMLKMELGEQAELLYRALTEQDFKIKEDKRDGKSCKCCKDGHIELEPQLEPYYHTEDGYLGQSRHLQKRGRGIGSE